MRVTPLGNFLNPVIVFRHGDLQTLPTRSDPDGNTPNYMYVPLASGWARCLINLPGKVVDGQVSQTLLTVLRVNRDMGLPPPIYKQRRRPPPRPVAAGNELTTKRLEPLATFFFLNTRLPLLEQRR